MLCPSTRSQSPVSDGETYSVNGSSRTSSLPEAPKNSYQEVHRPQQRTSTIEIRTICCIGAGYVGGPTAAIIALQNPHVRVIVVDKDCARIAKWNSRHLPVHEPGLYDIVRLTRDGGRYQCNPGHARDDDHIRAANLTFTTNIEESIAAADLIFLSVNTPTKMSGIGAGRAANLASIEGATKMVAQYASAGAIIVEKSTVPVHTADMIRDIIKIYRPNESFEILSNPEFLAEGTAISDLLKADRVLIGSLSTPAGKNAAAALADVYAAWIDRSKILTVNVWSSELTKLTANAMLAQRVSSINSISAICEAVGADINEISRAVGFDRRIGPQFLKAGIGFGGSCFKKDILSLTYLARSLDLPEIAEYWEQVLNINDFQRSRFVHRIVRRLNGNLTYKKVAILGFAFKKDTNDSRESPAIEVIKQMMAESPRQIAIFDPQCSAKSIKQELGQICRQHGLTEAFERSVECFDNAYEALDGAAAAVILTDWDQFRYPAMASNSDRTVSTFPTSHLGRHDAFQDDVSKTLLPQVELPCPSDCVDCVRNSAEGTGVHDSLDWERVKTTMQEPSWVFDGRGIVNPEGLQELGFYVESIGRMSDFPVTTSWQKTQRPGVARAQTS